MERRIALSIAAAAAIAITAGGAAFAANVGLLGSDKADPVGELSAANVVDLVPTTTTTPPVTPEVVVIDEYITVPGATPSVRSSGGVSPAPQQAGTVAPTGTPSTGAIATSGNASGDTLAPAPAVTPPTTDPGPGWEWDDDDQRWELEDDDDDYDDDDYDDDDHDEDDDDD